MPIRPPLRPALGSLPLAASLLCAAATPAHAQLLLAADAEPPPPLRLSEPNFSLAALAQPTAEQAEPESDAARFGEAPEREAYGDAGTDWLILGGAIGSNFDDATDLNLHIGYSYFLARNIEVVGELGLWYFDHEEGDAVGLNPNIVFRWHIINEGNWSFFADAGIGLLFSTDDVPADGTSFNFTPRAGIGFTRRITEGGGRLEAGLRWHHVSNARITGETDNPGHDTPLLYAAVLFPL